MSILAYSSDQHLVFFYFFNGINHFNVSALTIAPLLRHHCSASRNNLNVLCCCVNISGSVQTLFIFSQVFAIIREVDNPQLFTLEFVRGTTKKFMSTDRYIKGNES